MSKFIIGICSQTGPQSGKDYVAAKLLEWFRVTRMASSEATDYSIEIKRFADIIKHNVSELIGCDALELESGFFKDHMYWNTITDEIVICPANEKGLIVINNFESYKNLFNVNLKAFIKIRVLLQVVGDGLKSLHGDRVFINNVLNNFNSNSNSIIVPDVRFIEEVNAIRALPNSILICVNRGEIIKKGHSSDTGLKDFDDFDYTIDNNGSIKELENKVVDIFLRYLLNQLKQ